MTFSPACPHRVTMAAMSTRYFSTLHAGDCLKILPTLRANSVDAIVTDAPYGLTANKNGGSGEASLNLNHPGGRSRITTGGGFMGQKWDAGVPGPEYWRAALRVAKPGAYLLAFGGTRTFHRLACAIEDAGWELGDCIGWIYGQGFPKSHNGPWGGTALKPAWEPILVCRKPLVGTVAQNVLLHGTGGINVDGCRVPGTDEEYARNCSGDRGHAGNRKRAMDFAMTGGKASSVGRWPANVITDGSPEVLELFPDQCGGGAPSRRFADKFRNAYGTFKGAKAEAGIGPTSGSAARFFYCAKASKRDRGDGNLHPTVKPTTLMRYLCRLVTPPNGLILDPFMGSGSTGKAARLEGFRFLGIESDRDYLRIARRRIA
jgi:site-specific DNA-methyltransferase (adenine-specific)